LKALLLFAGIVRECTGTNMGPNLHRLFEDVDQEIPTGTPLPVQPLTEGGAFPDWLQFDRYNNGFGRFGGWDDPADQAFEYNYLFDVMGYVTKFSVANGAVTFGTQLLHSSVLNESSSTIPPFRTFGGTTPAMNHKQWMETLTGNPTSDNLNVHVVHANEGNIIAVSDMTGYFELDADTLASRGNYEWAAGDPIAGNILNVITSAHPTQLPGDNFMYNYHVEVAGGILPNASDLSSSKLRSGATGLNKIMFWRTDMSVEGPLEREIFLELEQTRISYCHQVSQTPKYLVFVEYPLLWALQDIPLSEAMLGSLVWRPHLGTRFRLINKATGEVDFDDTIEDAIFAYHQVNAFEVADSSGATEVVVDILTVQCTNSSGPAKCNHMNAFNLDTLRNNSFNIPTGPLLRYTLPVGSAEGSPGKSKIGAPRILSTDGLDLTGIHPDKHGQSHRYMYALGNEGEGVWYNKIVKLDLEPSTSSKEDPTPTNKTWYKYDHYPTEVFFVPRPGTDLAEDDGVLLSVVLDGAANHSYILALDAATMQPLAQANTSITLPFLSHGQTCVQGRGCWSGA
jgi:carotenoid cleavage dioxygenase-like enzyme